MEKKNLHKETRLTQHHHFLFVFTSQTIAKPNLFTEKFYFNLGVLC